MENDRQPLSGMREGEPGEQESVHSYHRALEPRV